MQIHRDMPPAQAAHGPAIAQLDCTGPAIAQLDCTGPAVAQLDCTGPAHAHRLTCAVFLRHKSRATNRTSSCLLAQKGTATAQVLASHAAALPVHCCPLLVQHRAGQQPALQRPLCTAPAAHPAPAAASPLTHQAHPSQQGPQPRQPPQQQSCMVAHTAHPQDLLHH